MTKHRLNLDYEKTLQEEGFDIIAGIDEAGRGAWAGPVYAGAVVFDPDMNLDRLIDVIDSKLLTPQKRDELFEVIMDKALAVGIGFVNNKEIDKTDIKESSFEAMRMAINQLKHKPDYLLVDAFKIEKVSLPQKNIIKGDQKIFSIAAASIVAKVSRDREMERLNKQYPGYSFDEHKGYGTKKHQEALGKLGVCDIHRVSYKPIKQLVVNSG